MEYWILRELESHISMCSERVENVQHQLLKLTWKICLEEAIDVKEKFILNHTYPDKNITVPDDILDKMD